MLVKTIKIINMFVPLRNSRIKMNILISSNIKCVSKYGFKRNINNKLNRNVHTCKL